MNGSTDQTRWNEVMKAIFRRSSYDEAFRALCLRDPSSMFQQYFGIELSEPVSFSEKEDGSSLVLPSLIKVKLEAEDLKVVSDAGEMKLARYENWGSESVGDLYKNARYENWGGE